MLLFCQSAAFFPVGSEYGDEVIKGVIGISPSLISLDVPVVFYGAKERSLYVRDDLIQSEWIIMYLHIDIL